jgi:hypothetical protein
LRQEDYSGSDGENVLPAAGKPGEGAGGADYKADNDAQEGKSQTQTGEKVLATSLGAPARTQPLRGCTQWRPCRHSWRSISRLVDTCHGFSLMLSLLTMAYPFLVLTMDSLSLMDLGLSFFY